MIDRRITNTTLRTNPMLALTVLCWSSMGYILGNKYRRAFFVPPVLMLIATISSFLFFSGEKLEMLILNLYFFMLFLNTGVRIMIIRLSIDIHKMKLRATHLQCPFRGFTVRIHEHSLLCVNLLLQRINSFI